MKYDLKTRPYSPRKNVESWFEGFEKQETNRNEKAETSLNNQLKLSKNLKDGPIKQEYREAIAYLKGYLDRGKDILDAYPTVDSRLRVESHEVDGVRVADFPDEL